MIFEADTPTGKFFDVALLMAILVSVVAVMLESVPSIDAAYGGTLDVVEWILTGLFTLEYVVRLATVRRPLRYAVSFYGLVDLAAVLPTYLSLILPNDVHSLLIIRSLRLLRAFRVLKLTRYLGEANVLLEALKAGRPKIVVFLGTVFSINLIIGALMYLIEGSENGFTSIPRGVYWAIVTMTTVGFGDITPRTPLGQAVASLVMILGYSIIAVPTGIVTAELTHMSHKPDRQISTRVCPSCVYEGHDRDAHFCKYCGAHLDVLHPRAPTWSRPDGIATDRPPPG